jgi:hypothetical protein
MDFSHESQFLFVKMKEKRQRENTYPQAGSDGKLFY